MTPVDREQFHMRLALSRSHLEEVVGLAGQTKVDSYTRHTKAGKSVQVHSYMRDVKGMDAAELFSEFKDLAAGGPGNTDPAQPQQKRNRLAQVTTEIRARKAQGKWHPATNVGPKDAGIPDAPKIDVSSNSHKAPESPIKLPPRPSTGHSSSQEFDRNRQVPRGKMTDAEYADHVDKVRAIINDPANKKYDTQNMYGLFNLETNKPIEGEYTAERAAQHKQIINDILDAHKHVPTDRKAVMSGGLGGAGKGYVLKGHAGINEDDYLTVDPDKMKQELLKRGMVPEVPGLLPLEHAKFMHEESSDLANLLQQVAMKKGMNIILDTTMASPGSVKKKLNKFHDAKYDTEAVFVDVPISVSMESALGRHRGGVDRFRSGKEEDAGDLGGRFVPPEYIQASAPSEGSQYNSKNRETFEAMKHLFTRSRVFDNSDRRKPEQGGKGPQLVSDSAAKVKKKDASKTTARAMDKAGGDKVKLSASVTELLRLTSVSQ